MYVLLSLSDLELDTELQGSYRKELRCESVRKHNTCEFMAPGFPYIESIILTTPVDGKR
jgi:hypothetical protein